jgi:UDP-N-acetylmuramoyl-tripeptide--D-alanyl-D-alanine ligase
MKYALEFIIKIITILIIRKYKPVIIGITGSVGKTSTKDAIYSVFSKLKRVRKSSGNLNTEIGAPLVFFKEKKAGEGIFGWFLVILKGVWLVLKKDKEYPEVVIVEMAADKPGDLEYLGSFIKPDISIITAIGKVPVHVEFYKSGKEVAEEKQKIIQATNKKGVVILNNDDPYISEMETLNRDKITFGFNEEVDVKIKKIKEKSLKGSKVSIEYKNKDYSFFLFRCIGKPFGYISASVFSVGIALGLNPEEVVKAMSKIRPTNGRMSPIRGVNETFIIDGSYNASPSSTRSALATLKKVPGKRKIAVIGDMLELGKYSTNEHRKIGKIAEKCCDYLFAVGNYAHIIEKSAVNQGMDKNKVFSYLKSVDAIEKIEEVASSGDVILVKGSQGVRTEKIVLAIMRDPEKAEKLLVRQDKKWKSKE